MIRDYLSRRKKWIYNDSYSLLKLYCSGKSLWIITSNHSITLARLILQLIDNTQKNMSSAVAIEHKKPTRRLSMSSIFGSSHKKTTYSHKPTPKTDRKMSGGSRKSLDFNDVIIEEVDVIACDVTQVAVVESPPSDCKHLETDGTKVPIPKEDIARNALNREIRSKKVKLGRKKRHGNDSSSNRSIWDSFRNSRKPAKFKSYTKSKEMKAEKARNHFAGSKSATVDFSYTESSATGSPLSEMIRARNMQKQLAEAAVNDGKLCKSHSVESPRQYDSQTSEDEYCLPTRKVQDLSSIKVVRDRRVFRKVLRGGGGGGCSEISDEDGLSSASNTPSSSRARRPSLVSIQVIPCSNSESDSYSASDAECKNHLTTPPTPLDDVIDHPFDSPLFFGSVTLPRCPKNKKKSGTLDNKKSRSQESLLTTIVNAVTKRNGKGGSDNDTIDGVSSFVASFDHEPPKQCSTPSSEHSTIVTGEAEYLYRSTDTISALGAPPNYEQALSYSTEFTTWEGREASTLPRPRHRKIGNVGKISTAA